MPAVSAQLDHFIAPERHAASAKPGRFARFMRAVQEARLKQAEREVARFIEAQGGRMTDTLERQIERHFI